MTTSKCRVCGKETTEAFKAKLMNKYDVSYFLCANCEFMQVEQPYWLDEAYDSPMNLTDTGIMYRNLAYSKIVSAVLYTFFDIKGDYLDYAGGYGVFTRLMRDVGLDFYWHDIYTTNLLARGFEYEPKKKKKLAGLTAFETFEHFVDPIPEMEKILKIGDTMIFSTQMRPEMVPDPEEWWYYGKEHGQHTALYRVKTLEFIAKKFKLNLFTNEGDFHLMTSKKLLPKFFESIIFYAEILPSVNVEQKELLKKAYSKSFNPNPVEEKQLNFIQKLRQPPAPLYEAGSYVLLDEKLSASEKNEVYEILMSGKFIRAAFINAFNKADSIMQTFVTPNLKSKTFDDMLYMKQFMHTK